MAQQQPEQRQGSFCYVLQFLFITYWLVCCGLILMMCFGRWTGSFYVLEMKRCDSNCDDQGRFVPQAPNPQAFYGSATGQSDMFYCWNNCLGDGEKLSYWERCRLDYGCDAAAGVGFLNETHSYLTKQRFAFGNLYANAMYLDNNNVIGVEVEKEYDPYGLVIDIEHYMSLEMIDNEKEMNPAASSYQHKLLLRALANVKDKWIGNEPAVFVDYRSKPIDHVAIRGIRLCSGALADKCVEMAANAQGALVIE